MAASYVESIPKKKLKKHKKTKFFSIKSCFGFSKNNNQYDVEDVNIDGGGGKKSAINGNKRSSSNRAKTVPVNDSMLTVKAYAVAPSKEIHVVEAEEKGTDHRDQVNDQEAKSTILEKTKSSLELDSVKSMNIPQETHSKRRKLLHSFSMPLPRLRREKTTSHDGGTKGKNGNESILEDEFEPLVGALILIVVLIVMLIWGKVCAVLCAAMWFYFIPSCNNMNKSSSTVMKLEKNSSDRRVDLDSKEYKKKVVLEGLLERSQQHARV